MIPSTQYTLTARLYERLPRRTFLLFACLLLALTSVAAQSEQAQTKDISGTWVAKTQTPMGDLEIVYELKVQNGRITGTQKLPFGDAPIVASKFDGDRFELTIELESFGDTQKATAKGKIVGDTLEITPAFPKPPEGAGGPGGAPPAMFSSSMVFHRGKPTPSNRAPAVDYNSLPKIQLPALHSVLYNGLAATPPMGWNSWNKFHTNITDRTIREIANAMASSGMRDAGYQYLIIDDGWQGQRDDSGRLQPNSNFPDMKALADYVHSKGLKLGIYSSPGPRTCGGFEGSYGQEEMDAKTWAAWGIDYLKYDWCSASRVWKDSQMQAVYQRMGDALRATGRQIVFALCQYGRANVGDWGASVGANSWRTTGDISDSWVSMSSIGFSQSSWARFARPGHWNDPDMLEVGNGGMSTTEYRTHFTLWAILAAPLIAGNDLRNMSPEITGILTNKEVIAVNQDKLGRAGERVSKNGDIEVWVRSLDAGAYAVAFFNRGLTPAPGSLRWTSLEIDHTPKVRDLWQHVDVPSSADGFTVSVPGHDVVLIRVSP